MISSKKKKNKKKYMHSNGKKSVDANVLIYQHDDYDLRKQHIAEKIVNDNPVVTAQALAEYLGGMEKKFRKEHPKGTPLDITAKAFILKTCASSLMGTHVQPVNADTLIHAENLVQQHGFQLRDAVIVAASIEAGCTTLYSEDMKHEDLVDQQLYIKNPFVMDEFRQQLNSAGGYATPHGH
jgi:predicted nucleic acid-binding protein